MNYFKLFEMNSFFTLHIFLEVGKTQDLDMRLGAGERRRWTAFSFCGGEWATLASNFPLSSEVRAGALPNTDTTRMAESMVEAP
jgi:hypothetical protein